jgi:hypothetical protein
LRGPEASLSGLCHKRAVSLSGQNDLIRCRFDGCNRAISKILGHVDRRSSNPLEFLYV